jgi:hypothetical protein
VPREIADALRQFGCDVELLRDHLPTRAPDADVIAKAQELERILVSLNGDFADIVAYRPEAYGGIVAIQLHDHPETIPILTSGTGPLSITSQRGGSSPPDALITRSVLRRSAPDGA